jgi:hypothetical protein
MYRLENHYGLLDWIKYNKTHLSCLPLSQTWKTANRLSGGIVKTAFSEGGLFVFAELPDEDIFNPVTQFNQRAFTEGDVFEIFLQVPDAREYFEFHISPLNQKYQLRFDKMREGEGVEAFDARLIESPIESEVCLYPDENRWDVYALIDWRQLGLKTSPASLRVNFCRYDYTRRPDGNNDLEIYAAAPHRKPSFHRREEWLEWGQSSEGF